jgi:hypothetical protein
MISTETISFCCSGCFVLDFTYNPSHMYKKIGITMASLDLMACHILYFLALCWRWQVVLLSHVCSATSPLLIL